MLLCSLVFLVRKGVKSKSFVCVVFKTMREKSLVERRRRKRLNHLKAVNNQNQSAFTHAPQHAQSPRLYRVHDGSVTPPHTHTTLCQTLSTHCQRNTLCHVWVYLRRIHSRSGVRKVLPRKAAYFKYYACLIYIYGPERHARVEHVRCVRVPGAFRAEVGVKTGLSAEHPKLCGWPRAVGLSRSLSLGRGVRSTCRQFFHTQGLWCGVARPNSLVFRTAHTH